MAVRTVESSAGSAPPGADRVGFVGLGNQGAPIAMRILRGGFPLTVWARRMEVTERFQAAGAQVAADLAELGAACSLVAVCVTTDSDVHAVTVGTGALLASMRPGSSLALHSTVDPDTARAIARAGEARGVSVLDAPVSGGNAGATAGTMAVMVGGDRPTFERWRGVLTTFATNIELLGGVGAGQLMKLLNNAIASVTLGVSMQALAAASELGLDREATGRVLTVSSGDSFMLRQAIGITPEGMSLAVARLRKDLTLFDHTVSPADDSAASLAATARAVLSQLEREM
jgi:3-hydroxyisobutyrate dehydrogenase